MLLFCIIIAGFQSPGGPPALMCCIYPRQKPATPLKLDEFRGIFRVIFRVIFAHLYRYFDTYIWIMIQIHGSKKPRKYVVSRKYAGYHFVETTGLEP